mmetsp:Transcript_33731/g.79546  ORF Transcript_33731/g.79546 Transcript_33731/m.79546 type:complete len:250 (-) Transcript_33731:478-1227(-)
MIALSPPNALSQVSPNTAETTYVAFKLSSSSTLTLVANTIAQVSDNTARKGCDRCRVVWNINKCTILRERSGSFFLQLILALTPSLYTPDTKGDCFDRYCTEVWYSPNQGQTSVFSYFSYMLMLIDISIRALSMRVSEAMDILIKSIIRSSGPSMDILIKSAIRTVDSIDMDMISSIMRSIMEPASRVVFAVLGPSLASSFDPFMCFIFLTFLISFADEPTLTDFGDLRKFSCLRVLSDFADFSFRCSW